MLSSHTSWPALLWCLTTLVLFCWSCTSKTTQAPSEGSDPEAKRLFILSGQSNMARLDPRTSFIPTVESHFGVGKVIVVKDAQGGRPIRQWYRKWRPGRGDQPQGSGELYARLMTKVRSAIQGQRLQTVTFVWMQGEKDARESHGDVYRRSLLGLVEQFQTDLHKREVYVVIGRLSDFDMANRRYPHWTLVRQVQEELCRERSGWAMVDTDDLNGPDDDLHYTKEGYDHFGRRLAQAAIDLIAEAK
jgi:hypothetical protein